MGKYNFRCQYCDTGFVQEDRYLKHRCKQMQRHEEIQTPLGLAALEHYRTWMTTQKKVAPSAETFLNSSKYVSFIKFTKFAQKTNIPNVEQYIKFMVRKDMPPSIWCNDQVYGEYLRWVDKGSDPYKQASATVSYIMKVADALDCDTGEIFDHLTPNDAIVMLQQRRLTPWILLHSRKFQEFLQTAPVEQQVQMMSIIKPDTWKERRASKPDVVADMKLYVRELNL